MKKATKADVLVCLQSRAMHLKKLHHELGNSFDVPAEHTSLLAPVKQLESTGLVAFESMIDSYRITVKGLEYLEEHIKEKNKTLSEVVGRFLARAEEVED